MIAPAGSPGRIVAAILRGQVEAVITTALLDELLDVIGRPQLARYEIDDDVVGAILELVWPALPRVGVEVALRDVDDEIVVEAAIAGAAEIIVTGDKDLLGDADLAAWLTPRGISVITPAALLELLEAGRRRSDPPATVNRDSSNQAE